MLLTRSIGYNMFRGRTIVGNSVGTLLLQLIQNPSFMTLHSYVNSNISIVFESSEEVRGQDSSWDTKNIGLG